MAIPSLPDMHLDRLAREIAESLTHADFSRIFAQLGLAQGDGPRWRRIFCALDERQRRDRCGNNVGAFIEAALDPVNFLGREDTHDDLRRRVNELLAFHGLEVGANGKLAKTTPVTTLSEAEERASRLRAELRRRRVHEDVLGFCRPELVDGNYFHAVLEATKSLAEKLRSKSGLTTDGAELAQRAFGGKQPLLAINKLMTETERSQQSGFMNMLVGVFGMFRNPVAHAPKVTWPVTEDEALDQLAVISFLHRRLAAAVPTGAIVTI